MRPAQAAAHQRHLPSLPRTAWQIHLETTFVLWSCLLLGVPLEPVASGTANRLAKCRHLFLTVAWCSVLAVVEDKRRAQRVAELFHPQPAAAADLLASLGS